MTKINTEFAMAIATAQRQAVVEFAQANPRMTLNDLVALEGVGEITVGEVTTGRAATNGVTSGNGAAKGAAKAAAKEKRGRPTSDPAVVNTRSLQGREAFDAAVLRVLKKGTDWPAGGVRERAGGTAFQVRSSLARLIEAEKATYTGATSRTRYSAL